MNNFFKKNKPAIVVFAALVVLVVVGNRAQIINFSNFVASAIKGTKTILDDTKTVQKLQVFPVGCTSYVGFSTTDSRPCWFRTAPVVNFTSTNVTFGVDLYDGIPGTFSFNWRVVGSTNIVSTFSTPFTHLGLSTNGYVNTLTPLTNYEYQACSVTANGTGCDSWETFMTTADVTPPYVFFGTPPGSGPYYTYPTNSNPYTLAEGLATDNVGVARVTWDVNTDGLGPVDTVGYDNWSIPSVPLVPGLNKLTLKAYDAAGNSNSFYTTLDYSDITSPTISNVSVTSLTGTTASIHWDTNEPANSKVEYGIGTYAGGTFSDLTNYLTNGHLAPLTSLTPGSLYQYRITSKDPSSNQAQYTGTFTTTTSIWRPDHTVVLIEENRTFSPSQYTTNLNSGVGQQNQINTTSAPYLTTNLLTQGRLFTNSYGVTNPQSGLAHTSQTQYLHLFSGSNQGWNSNNCLDSTTSPASPLSTTNLGRELIDVGTTWAWYSEGLPSAGYVSDNGASPCFVNLYYQKHNPAPNWQGTGTNQYSGTTYNLPWTNSPITTGNFANLPDVTFITPNMDDDMHNGSIMDGDIWAQANIDAYAQWAKTNNSLLLVTFDESDPSGLPSDRIFTLMVGPSSHIIPNSTDPTIINHYSILRLLEDTYGSSTHAGGALTATQIALP